MNAYICVYVYVYIYSFFSPIYQSISREHALLRVSTHDQCPVLCVQSPPWLPRWPFGAARPVCVCTCVCVCVCVGLCVYVCI